MTDESDELSVRLARLETIETARGLLAAYARLVDERDVDGLAAIFAPDAVLTASGRPYEGRDAVVDFYRRAFSADPSGRRHFVTNVRVVDASASSATLSSYLLFTAGTGGDSVLGWGRYVDRVDVVDGAALITAKDIVVDHRGPVQAAWGAALSGPVAS